MNVVKTNNGHNRSAIKFYNMAIIQMRYTVNADSIVKKLTQYPVVSQEVVRIR